MGDRATRDDAARTDARGAAQLPLPLPPNKPRYDQDAFLIAPSNEAAWRAAEAWRDSDEPVLIICGPAGAGKTHLGHILAEGRGEFRDWREAGPAEDGAIVVFDDLPADDPRAFLSVMEERTGAGARTLLIGRGHPGEWAMGLADLRTRLEAMPRATLNEPDEALLRAVMSKAFQDRQLRIGPTVIEYAAPRLPRTFDAARGFVALADDLAARGKRKITVALAKEILDGLCDNTDAASPAAPEIEFSKEA